MRVFVTGATGFIGSAVVKELLGAGHEVLGMARSEESGKALAAAGARVHVGNLEDVESLRDGAAACEGAIHLAFYHELGHIGLGSKLRIFLGGAPGGIVTRFAQTAVNVDRRAIETIAGALKGQDRALVTAIGTLSMSPGRLATEDRPTDSSSVGAIRAQSERLILGLGTSGIRGSVIRLAPMVHDHSKQGLGTMMIDLARKKKVSPWIGDGSNRWPALHVLDAARLFRLALEGGSGVYHGVAEQGVPMREIAEAIGRRVKVPAKSVSAAAAKKHYGFLEMFVEVDNPASSKQTQERLDWVPTGPGVIGDLETAG